MKKILLLPILSVLLCSNLYANENIDQQTDLVFQSEEMKGLDEKERLEHDLSQKLSVDRNDMNSQEYMDALQLMSKHQLLEEIETLKKEVEELTQVGRMSSSVAMTVNGVLSTVAYAVATGAITAISNESDMGKSLVLNLVAMIVPGTVLSGYTAYKNTQPSIPFGQSLWLSLRSAVVSTGLWLAGSVSTKQFFKHVVDSDKKTFKNYHSILMLPVHLYIQYYNIISSLEDRKDRLFDLEFRLDQARQHLNRQARELEEKVKVRIEREASGDIELDADSGESYPVAVKEFENTSSGAGADEFGIEHDPELKPEFEGDHFAKEEINPELVFEPESEDFMVVY